MSNNTYIVSRNISVRLAKFERNFTKHDFYFVTQFMSKRKFYFETKGVTYKPPRPAGGEASQQLPLAGANF